MRKADDDGSDCPETLGEYRDFCAALGGESNRAVQFLDKKIAESANGRDEKVIVPDSQMRAVLFPLLAQSIEDEAKAAGMGKPA